MATTVVPRTGTVRHIWRDAKSVYYANTPTWRWLKGGTLLFFGFFCWSAASLLLAYRPQWDVLTYVMAYGFLLIVWGPLTHVVVVPATIRLRRSATTPAKRWLGRHGSKLNLTVFFTLVLIVGTVVPGVMVLDFSGALAGGGASPDATADLTCTLSDERVECSLENVRGVDHVVVLTGDRELERIDEGPYRFSVPTAALEEAARSKELAVELRDEEGRTLRRFVRTFPR